MSLSTWRKLWFFFPEIVFICTTLFLMGDLVYTMLIWHTSIFDTSNILTLAVIVLVLTMLIGQFFWRKFIVGILLSVVLFSGCFLFLLAGVSEYHELAITNISGSTLLSVALVISTLLGILAINMPWKYLKK